VRALNPVEDTGSYLLFKPAAMITSNSDYMAMPGVLKPRTAEAGGCDADRPSRLPVSSHAPSVSSSGAAHSTEYMEMAARPVASSKVVSERGNKLSEVPVKKLSTGSRGGDDYMSMLVHNDEGYVDMKTGSSRSTGRL